MKVVAFNGSPRRSGNTAAIIKVMFAKLEKNGIETELVQVGGVLKQGCTACNLCYKNKTKSCAVTGDPLND